MRDIFKKAFKANSLKYFNPHSFRNSLMDLAYELGLSGEALKAWSQNLGHEKLDTTINVYGDVSRDRQRALILGLHDGGEDNQDDRPVTRREMSELKEYILALADR